MGDSELWLDQAGVTHEPRRVQEVLAAEHSMTMGEERFYLSLWNVPSDADIRNESPDSRIFTLGYDRLAKLVRLDEKSVRQMIPKLIFKRILEVVAGENSSARQGRTYRIFSAAEILRRQQAAGLRHIVKRGRAVEFVWRSGQAVVKPTVGVTTTLTNSWSPEVDAALRVFGADPDAAAVRALVAACREKSPAATFDEIVYFIYECGRPLRSGRPVANPLAYLQIKVPREFEPEALQRHREAARDAEARQQQATASAAREMEKMRTAWKALLKDPAASAEDREWARQMLED